MKKALWMIATLAAVSAAGTVAAQDAAKTAPRRTASYDLRVAHAPKGDAAAGKAKAEVCSACHGADGNANLSMFPNMAGQKTDYLYWSLRAYHDGRMPESPMTVITSTLEEQDIRDLAAYYSSMAPASGPSVDAETVQATDPTVLARGQAIFTQGDTALGIPPCQGCHGADARGNPQAAYRDSSGRTPFVAYPWLRGQHIDYTQGRLQQFHDGVLDASTYQRVMSGVGKRLDPDSIKAVSSWLSSLQP